MTKLDRFGRAFSSELVKFNACREAVKWASEQKSAAAAWRDCQRGDWMLWLLGRLSGQSGSAARKKLVLCACACARLSLKHVPAGEDRPRLAIEKAEAYARGEAVTIDEVRSAAYAAAAAYSAAAYAAACAADAACAAAVYAAGAAAYDARTKTLAECATIVREHYPKPPRLVAKKGGAK